MSKTLFVTVKGRDELSGAFRRVGAQADTLAGKTRRMTHSLFLAGAGLVGVGGLAWGLRESVRAGNDWIANQRQLDRQIRTSHTSLRAAAPAVEDFQRKYLGLGFVYADSAKALAYTTRATGNLRSGISLAGMAADLARGRHIQWAQAALVLGKAWDGNTTALKRLGIQIPKNTSTQKALSIVQERFHGQARAGATALVVFSAVVGHLKEVVGEALMPTVVKLVNWLEKWLASVEKGGSRHAAFVKTVHQLESALRTAGRIMLAVAKDALKVKDAVGGWKPAFELIVSGYLAARLASLTGTLARFSQGMVETGKAAAVAEVGTNNLRSASGKFVSKAQYVDENFSKMSLAAKGFGATLKSVLVSGVITLALLAISYAAIYVITHWDKVKRWFQAFRQDMIGAFQTMWNAVRETGKAAIYYILKSLTIGITSMLQLLSHLPFVGKYARKALGEVQGFIDQFKPDWGHLTGQFYKAGQQASLKFQQGMAAQEQAQMPAGALGPTNLGKGAPPGAIGPTPSIGPNASRGGGKKGGGGTLPPPSKPPPIDKKTHKPTTLTGQNILPESIQLQIERARRTPNLSDDLRADKAAEAYLRKQLKRSDLSKKQRIADEKELTKVILAEQAARKKMAKATGVTSADVLPLRIQLDLAKALTTTKHADDLKADREAEAYLRKQLKRSDLSKKDQLADEKALGQVLAKKARDLKAYTLEVAGIVAKANALYFKVDWKFSDVQNLKFGTSAFDRIQRAMDGQWDKFFTEFDRATQKGIEQINARFDQPTPAEAALKRLQDSHDAKAAADKLAEDQAAYQQALAGGNPDEIKSAKAALDEDLYQLQVAALQRQADTERAAQDKARDNEIQRYDDERAAARKKFEDQQSAMDAWLTHEQDLLGKGLVAWKKFYKELGALAKQYGFVLGPRERPGKGGGSTAMAEGGVATHPTRALIGEAGPEAVVPLHKRKRGTKQPDMHPRDGDAISPRVATFAERRGDILLRAGLLDVEAAHVRSTEKAQEIHLRSLRLYERARKMEIAHLQRTEAPISLRNLTVGLADTFFPFTPHNVGAFGKAFGDFTRHPGLKTGIQYGLSIAAMVPLEGKTVRVADDIARAFERKEGGHALESVYKRTNYSVDFGHEPWRKRRSFLGSDLWARHEYAEFKGHEVGSGEINDFLRTGRVGAREKSDWGLLGRAGVLQAVRDLIRIMERNRLPHDLTLWRGVPLHGLERMGGSPESRAGADLMDKAFLSTGDNKGVALGYAPYHEDGDVILKIHAPAGMPFFVGEDREFVLPPSTHMTLRRNREMLLRDFDPTYARHSAEMVRILELEAHIPAKLPKLARGGIVRNPTLALVGEAGREEIVPLASAGGGGGPDVHVHLTGTVIGADRGQVAKELRDPIRREFVRLRKANVALGFN